MDVKKLLGGMSVVVVLALGTGVGAEPVKKAPVPQKAQPAPQETLRLKPGHVHDLPMKGMNRIAIGDPEVADIKVTGDVIHIRALKKGETTLLVWTGKDARHAYTLSVGD